MGKEENGSIFSFSVSQSLAGRVAIFNLLPFSLEEIKNTDLALPDYEDYIFKGFYPRIYDLDLDPATWLLDYTQTYVERDLRQILHVSDLGAARGKFFSIRRRGSPAAKSGPRASASGTK